jgi:hypothetical protein
MVVDLPNVLDVRFHGRHLRPQCRSLFCSYISPGFFTSPPAGAPRIGFGWFWPLAFGAGRQKLLQNLAATMLAEDVIRLASILTGLYLL